MTEKKKINFKFNLSEEDAVLLLEGLGELPFKRVADLVYKIRTQAQEQIMESESESDPAKPSVGAK